MKSCEPKITYSKESINLGEINTDKSRRSHQKNRNRELKHQFENVQRKSYKDGIVDAAVKKLGQSYTHSNAEEAVIKVNCKTRECFFNFIDHNRQRSSNKDRSKCLRSKSEFGPPSVNDNEYSMNKREVIHPSIPAIYSTRESGDGEKEISTKKKKPAKIECTKTGSIEKLIEKYDQIVFENVGNPPVCSNRTKTPIWKDPRLREKYSVLKVPWEKSQSLSVCTVKPSAYRKEVAPVNQQREESPSRKTYYYDEGSDIDSLCLQQMSESPTDSYEKVMQAQVFTLPNIVSCVFFVATICLLLWFFSANQILRDIFFPKPPESTFKRSLKLVGGGVMYSISSILRFIGRILTIPTQHVYQSPQEDLWPPDT